MTCIGGSSILYRHNLETEHARLAARPTAPDLPPRVIPGGYVNLFFDGCVVCLRSVAEQAANGSVASAISSF